MTPHTAVAPAAPPATLLRNEPVQARSNARLAELLDAAAAVVEEIGYERLTTAMVAERAGSSIGTVYRYFPDRIAVLQALSARSLTKFFSEGVEKISSGSHHDWAAAVGSALDYWVDAFRHETGFRSLRFGDVIDLRPRAGAQTNNATIAGAIADVVSDKHGLAAGRDLQFHLEVALEICDALLARAFSMKPGGDKKFIAEATGAARAYLVSIYGDPRS